MVKKISKTELKIRLNKIKIFVMDFDGIMTDGYVYIDEKGNESVRCSRKDGLGIALLKKTGIKVAVISKEKNIVVSSRCKKLDIPYWQGVDKGQDKVDIIKNYLNRLGIYLDEVAFMGDDIQDIPLMKRVGLGITVADSCFLVKGIAQYITKSKGGNHAVREICDVILQSKNIIPEV